MPEKLHARLASNQKRNAKKCVLPAAAHDEAGRLVALDLIGCQSNFTAAWNTLARLDVGGHRRPFTRMQGRAVSIDKVRRNRALKKKKKRIPARLNFKARAGRGRSDDLAVVLVVVNIGRRN